MHRSALSLAVGALAGAFLCGLCQRYADCTTGCATPLERLPLYVIGGALLAYLLIGRDD